MSNIKYVIIIGILCLIVGFFIGISTNNSEDPKVVTEVKWIRDTIKVEVPVPVPTPDTEIVYEYVEVPGDNIIIEGDSIYVAPVAIPFESKTYETKDYKAVVEGYKPRLTEMTLYPETKIETITETKYKKPKLQLGIGAGVSYIPSLPAEINKFQPTIQIGIYVPIKTIF